MSKLRSVITADIVNSASARIEVLAEKLEQTVFRSQPLARIFFYRGDSFQIYLPDPQAAYRLALQLRITAILIEKDRLDAHTDVRLSIGIGAVEQPVTQLATAQGEAFLLSGRGFDELANTDRRLSIHCSHIPIQIGFQTISLFTDYLFQSLTFKQAEVLAHLLNQLTQLETAKLLNKSQSTINKHVQSMGWKQLHELMDLYEKSIQWINDHA